MLHARRQVREIIRPHCKRLVPVVQNALAFQNEITFFFAIVEHVLAITVSIESNFSEPGHASQDSILRVTFAKDWFVVARLGCQVRWSITYTRNIAMQPRGLNFRLLSYGP